MDPEDADKWNLRVASGSFPSDLDKEGYDTAMDQMKKQLDAYFGKGRWSAIKRRGLQQRMY